MIATKKWPSFRDGRYNASEVVTVKGIITFHINQQNIIFFEFFKTLKP